MASNESVARTVFFISDHSGVTAETMGHSLLSQFEGISFRAVTLPFISTLERAAEARQRINATALADGAPPIIFSTLVRDAERELVKGANGLFLDFFGCVPGAAGIGTRTRRVRTRWAALTA